MNIAPTVVETQNLPAVKSVRRQRMEYILITPLAAAAAAMTSNER